VASEKKKRKEEKEVLMKSSLTPKKFLSLVCSHGFGANYFDLLPIGQMILNTLPSPKVCFFFFFSMCDEMLTRFLKDCVCFPEWTLGPWRRQSLLVAH
jgi:hypothetical protein